MNPISLMAACAALLPAAAFAHDGMAVLDAYIRTSGPAAMSAAAFMQLDNHRAVPCTLTAVTTPAAQRAELHTHKTDAAGMMQMTKIEGGITIAPNAGHALARGADHVMLMGLTAPLTDGAKVPLTLDFGDCGMLEIEVPVDSARMPDGAHGAHAGTATAPAIPPAAEHGEHGDHAGHTAPRPAP